MIPINFPGNVMVVNEQLLEIATFDIVPTDDFYPQIFNLDTDNMEPLNKHYEAANFETQNLLLNMGSLLLVLLFIKLKFFVIGITKMNRIKDKKYV